MATLPALITFVNATTAVAADVNTNFVTIKTFVEGISTGTNIDAGAITYAMLAAATITSLNTTIVSNAAHDDQVILGGLIFS